AFEVFGPKIVATRGLYDDKALESRFLTEQTGGTALRADIPINLPDAHAAEAAALRDKLLAYRIRTLHGQRLDVPDLFPELEPRLRQIVAPLCAVCPDEETRWDILEVARALSEDLQSERGMTIEANPRPEWPRHAAVSKGVPRTPCPSPCPTGAASTIPLTRLPCGLP